MEEVGGTWPTSSRGKTWMQRPSWCSSQRWWNVQENGKRVWSVGCGWGGKGGTEASSTPVCLIGATHEAEGATCESGVTGSASFQSNWRAPENSGGSTPTSTTTTPPRRLRLCRPLVVAQRTRRSCLAGDQDGWTLPAGERAQRGICH